MRLLFSDPSQRFRDLASNDWRMICLHIRKLSESLHRQLAIRRVTHDVLEPMGN